MSVHWFKFAAPRNFYFLAGRLWPWFAGAAALLVAGCGGGGSGGGTPGPGPGPGPGLPDTVEPSATLLAPAPLASGLTGLLALSAQASDDTGVAAVEFELDGQPVGAPDATAPYEASIDTAAHAAGQHVVRVRARDAAGNLSPWSSATVRFGGAASVGAGFEKNESWVTGLANATAFARAPDGRLFVA